VTVIRDAAGRYFASFVVQTAQDETLPITDSEIGIDLGLTHFAVLSDGTKVTAPKFLRRAARRLKRLQQALSRKQRGSSNRKKAVVKVARAHARVADTRRDWQHKLSTAIIRDNQAVYVEDLCVVGLGRTRLAKSVHDAGWASFTGMLEYKAARYGRTFARVDRFFPSTRMCSQCGRISDKMALNVRAWDCLCGAAHDRDVNAAKNVLAAGQADNSNDRGAQVRPAFVLAPRRSGNPPGRRVFHAPRVPRAAWRESSSFRAERMSMLIVDDGAAVGRRGLAFYAAPARCPAGRLAGWWPGGARVRDRTADGGSGLHADRLAVVQQVDAGTSG
jgi:IS605 OrfB family transposase